VTPTPTPTPGVNELTLWCTHSASALYLAGIITDTRIYSATGNFSDTLVLALDGWGDGFTRLGYDDRELFIGPNGRIRDFGSYPVTATVGVSLTASGWQFEVGLDRHLLGDAKLSPGAQVGAAFELRDVDQAGRTVWERLLTWAKFALRME
jgi:hypothetical protein